MSERDLRRRKPNEVLTWAQGEVVVEVVGEIYRALHFIKATLPNLPCDAWYATINDGVRKALEEEPMRPGTHWPAEF